MKKRLTSLFMALILLCGMLSAVSLPANAVSVDASKHLIVGKGWTAETIPDYYTYNGATFILNYGVNAFGSVNDAITAATAGDTIFVTEGTYDEQVIINKNITIAGVQNGVDPNAKGGEFAPWTLNENRGTKETIFTNYIMLGVTNTTVYSSVTDITIDGIMLTAGAQLRSNNGAAGQCNITLNNIYIKNPTLTTPPVYLEPFYGGANLYKRNVVIKNLRYEGLTKALGIALSAESADISGVYMHSDCTKALFDHLSASTVTEDNAPAVTWTVRDSRFCNPVYRVMYASTDNVTVNEGTIKLTESIGKRESVTFNLRNSTFLGCHAETGNGHIVACRPATDNFYFNITGNTFYTTKLPGVATNPIAGYVTNTSINYGNKVTVSRNRIIGYRYAFSFSGAGDASNVNGNYHEQLDGTVGPIAATGPVTQTWWYLNRDLTARSDGGVVNVSADRLLNLNTDVKFMGRAYDDGNVRYFSWTNGGFSFNFKGTGASCTIHSNGAGGANLGYLNVYVDDVLTKTVTLGATKQSVVLATGLPNGNHSIRVIKRTNGRSSSAGVSRIWLDEGGTIHHPDEISTRKMQFVGDSITVGYGSMGDESTASWSTATEDGTITYAALTAKYFNAENHTIAVSGRGIVKNNGGDTTDYAPAMYEYTDWRKHDQWDHSQYVPDVIVINYGTNDKSANVAAADFKAGCKAFVQQVRKDNPTSIIIYAYGFMGNPYATQVSEVVSELNAAGDKKIHYLALTPIGTGEKCLGHPNAAAHADRAQTLIAKVKEVTGWTQETSHSYVATTTGAPTCRNEGVRVKICSLCGDAITEAISAVPHTPAPEIFPLTPADCKNDGIGYKRCSVCGKVAEKSIVIPATGKHSAGAPDSEGHINCVICDTLLKTVPVNGNRARLEIENSVNSYFANGAYQVLAAGDEIVMRAIDGDLYKDQSCTQKLAVRFAVLPGKTTYYVKADDGSVYPLYLYRETGTPKTYNTYYIDDDIGDATGKVAFWDGVNVYFLDGGVNAANTMLDAEQFINQARSKNGAVATIYVAPGYYDGNESDAINSSAVILGSNHNINPNLRLDNNSWALNDARLPETVIDGSIFTYFNTNDKEVSFTVKGCTFVGESGYGPLYIAEGRADSHTCRINLDIRNNIFRGWGTSFNSSSIWINTLSAKDGVIKDNYFEFVAPDGMEDNPDDFCRGIFMRNPDGVVIDANRFVNYLNVMWMSGEMGDKDTTRYGHNVYTFQNNRLENCGSVHNYTLNAAKLDLNILNNDFISGGNGLGGAPIQLVISEIEELPVNYNNLALTVQGNRFIDCNRSVRIQRYSDWLHTGDMRDMTININENRFLIPSQVYTEATPAVSSLELSFYCDETQTHDMSAADAKWDFTRNYFYAPDFETNVNDPTRYFNLNIEGGKSFQLESDLYAPYYTDYEMKTLSNGSTASALTGVSAVGFTGQYDGAPHSITVTAPQDATVKYALTNNNAVYGGVNPTFTDAGTYTVYYKVEKTGVAPVTGSATVTITPNTSARTRVADKEVTYTYGKTYSLDAFADLKPNDTVVYTYLGNTYPDMPVFSAAGTYPIGIKVTNPNYVTFEQTATLTIAKASLTNVTMTGFDDVYDGKKHQITFGNLPTDVVPVYSVNGGAWSKTAPAYTTPTDGAMTVTVKLESVNYVTRTEDIVLNVRPATIEGVTATATNLTADGSLKNLVTVSGTKSGDTVRFAVSGGEFSASVPTARRPGTYTVAVLISRPYHTDKLLVINSVIADGVLPTAAFVPAISDAEVTEDANDRYTFAWTLDIAISSFGQEAMLTGDFKVTAYGLKYAASAEDLEEYTFLMNYAQTADAAAMITSGHVQEFIYDDSTSGFETLYKTNHFYVSNTKPNKARYAVFFIRYELDGTVYESYSTVSSISNFPVGDIADEGAVMNGTELIQA